MMEEEQSHNKSSIVPENFSSEEIQVCEAIADLRSMVYRAIGGNMEPLNRHKCFVCGELPQACTNYAFFENGQISLLVPFCKKHIGVFWCYSNPVFESPKALELFQSRHPKLYQLFVKDRIVLFQRTEKIELSTIQ